MKKCARDLQNWHLDSLGIKFYFFEAFKTLLMTLIILEIYYFIRVVIINTYIIYYKTDFYTIPWLVWVYYIYRDIYSTLHNH